jgi:hypothetical protein
MTKRGWPRGLKRGPRVKKPAPPAVSPEGALQALVQALIAEPSGEKREDCLTSIERGLLRTAVEVEVRNNERMTAS